MADDAQSSPTLHCPECGYNLTALPENRCPECGREFDPEVEAARSASQRPIDLAGVLIRLIWPPALLVMSPLFMESLFPMPPFTESQFYGTLFIVSTIAGGNLLVFGVFNARNISRRLAATRALRAGRGVCRLHDREFISNTSVGLYVCQ